MFSLHLIVCFAFLVHVTSKAATAGRSLFGTGAGDCDNGGSSGCSDGRELPLGNPPFGSSLKNEERF